MRRSQYFALQALALVAGVATAEPFGTTAGLLVWFTIGLLIDRLQARHA